jgi:hypothetical protein
VPRSGDRCSRRARAQLEGRPLGRGMGLRTVAVLQGSRRQRDAATFTVGSGRSSVVDEYRTRDGVHFDRGDTCTRGHEPIHRHRCQELELQRNRPMSGRSQGLDESRPGR